MKTYKQKYYEMQRVGAVAGLKLSRGSSQSRVHKSLTVADKAELSNESYQNLLLEKA